MHPSLPRPAGSLLSGGALFCPERVRHVSVLFVVVFQVPLFIFGLEPSESCHIELPSMLSAGEAHFLSSQALGKLVAPVLWYHL